MICAICQDDLLEDVYKLQCGHTFHKDCIINNALHGNLLCCICRGLPIKDASFDSIRQNAENSYDEQNRRSEDKAFRLGLRWGRDNKGSQELIKLVRQFDFEKQKDKEATALYKLKTEAFRTIKTDIEKAVDKVMSLKRNKTILAACKVKHLSRVYIRPSFSRGKYLTPAMMRRFKRNIAQAVGFKPLELL